MILKHAWRSWRNSKGIALLAAIALAAGIGSATAIYTVVNVVLLMPLPYRDGYLFVVLLSATLNDPEHYGSLASKDAEAYEQRTRVFDAFGWWRASGQSLTFAGEPHHVQGVAVTTSLVRQLGVNPVFGQWFQDENGVVISNVLWRQLGSDPGIVGKGLTFDGRGYVVTGVMPESFRLPVAGIISTGLRADLWIALDRHEKSDGIYFAYARLKPGVTLAAAEADVKRVAAEIAAKEPADHPAYTARLFSLREAVVKDIRPTLLVLFAAAGLLFLITCANAAGLLLSRSVDRVRETALRVALGAGRGQLAAQFFAEGMLVSLAGAAGGILLSITITPAIVLMAASYIPRADEISVDWKVLLFAIAAAFVASALSGLAPLWQAARTAPADVLGEGIRASAGMRSRRLSQSLVVGETALAFGLLAVGVVLIIHVHNLSGIPPGFDADHLLTFVLNVPAPIAGPKKRIPLERQLIEEIRTIPGVEDVALTNELPLKGCCTGTAIYPDGHAQDFNGAQRNARRAVSPEYFRVLRIPLQSGRVLTDHDTADDLAYVVINQAASKHYWSNRDPVGTYGRLGRPDGDRFQVVGVVGDIKNDGPGNPTAPEVYILSSIIPVESLGVAVRSLRSPDSLVPEIRRVVHNIAPEQPIYEIATMQEIVRQRLTLERVASFMTAFFAVVGLLLAMLGVYSMVAYSVRQRTVEIGTRIALGATRKAVLTLVVLQGLKMAVYGMLGGGFAAMAGVFYLGRFLQIENLGPAPFLYSTTTVAAAAFASSFIPAWRASLLSPMVAIRNDSESIWQTAQRSIHRVVLQLSAAAEQPVVPVGTVIREFAESIRRTASFPEAIDSALLSLREHVRAQSIILIEKASAEEYRTAKISLPATGVLLKRLAHFPHPLSLTPEQLDTWREWTRQFRPEHTSEIETLANTGARLAIPLRTKNEIVGVLLLGPPESRESYTPAEKHMLSSSAEVFALMIENSRLNQRALEQEKLRRELELAADVQRRLLPPEPPASKVATLAAFSLPARTVGGDYYDFLEQPGDQVGIAIADVSGKGIAAALLMSVVQASLRAVAAESEVSLSQLAVKLNGFLYRSSGTNKYATFFYAQIDQKALRLRYVNAGHNPPYLVRQTDSGVDIMELKVGGTVLGLFPEVEYEEAGVDLRTGDLFVAFTDGVTEALNPNGEEFGDERLKNMLCGTVGAPAQDIASKLRDTMQQWIGDAEQHDDLTVVVMAVK
jgi:predicted permease